MTIVDASSLIQPIDLAIEVIRFTGTDDFRTIGREPNPGYPSQLTSGKPQPCLLCILKRSRGPFTERPTLITIYGHTPHTPEWNITRTYTP